MRGLRLVLDDLQSALVDVVVWIRGLGQTHTDVVDLHGVRTSNVLDLILWGYVPKSKNELYFRLEG